MKEKRFHKNVVLQYKKKTNPLTSCEWEMPINPKQQQQQQLLSVFHIFWRKHTMVNMLFEAQTSLTPLSWFHILANCPNLIGTVPYFDPRKRVKKKWLFDHVSPYLKKKISL